MSDPQLLATTGSTYNGTILDTQERELRAILDSLPANDKSLSDEAQVRLLRRRRRTFSEEDERNVFRNVQWTPDGTSLVTTSEDCGVRMFIVPPDLLEERQEPVALQPYSVYHYPESIYSTAIYPWMFLQDPSTCLALVSTPDHPLTLQSLLAPTWTQSYPNICTSTERFLPAYSLTFTPTPPHFLAGSDSRICLFDLTRYGSGPVSTMMTTPTRSAPLNTERMKGIVSSMAISSDGILAAGTFGGSVGLYDHEGSGSAIAVFNCSEKGGGVTGLKWSTSGQYLYVLQRRSTEILMYDVRVISGLVATLKGFKGETNQRIAVDVAENGEVWGGGTDGVVRIWDGQVQDECIREWRAHDATVSATALHPTASVVATCCGHRTYHAAIQDEDEAIDLSQAESDDSGGEKASRSAPLDVQENSLRIWRI